MKNAHICNIRVTEGKIENLKKEGKMSISTFIFIYKIHFAYLKVYTKFHNPYQVVAEKTLTKNVHMCYKGVKEGKKEKEDKMSFSIFIFICTIHLAYLKVYTKFESTGSNRDREICDRYAKFENTGSKRNREICDRYTTFENTGSKRNREICDRNVH